GRKNISGYAGMALLGALRAQNPKPKTQTPKPKPQTPKPKTQNPKPKTQNPKPKTQKILPAAGRKNIFKLLRFFPAHSGQPADEKIRSPCPDDSGQGSWYRM